MKCTDCNGSGIWHLPICQDETKCETCNGTGKINNYGEKLNDDDCEDCGGTGVWTIISTKGKPNRNVNCQICNGSGKIKETTNERKNND